MKPSTERVLDRLRAGEGDWVRGNDLAEVAGWRFSARVYELRHEHGFTIERRSDPVSAVDQYRLVEKPEQMALGIAS